MAIENHLEEFFGKPAKEFEAGKAFDIQQYAPRLTITYEDYEVGKVWADLFTEFLNLPDASETTHLIVGAAEGFEGDMTSSMTLETLIANQHKLPKLEALFIGDIISEECELSWIEQGNFEQLWPNFPNLKALGIRGYPGVLGNIHIPTLEYFTIQSSGLSSQNAKDIQAAELPNLTHLEVWIGTSNYGGETDVDDWTKLFSGNIFPKLSKLGLKNCDYVDDIARVIADAPLVDRLTTLDLSMGNMSDEGGVALYQATRLQSLETIDLSHHFMTDWMIGRFKGQDHPIPNWSELSPPFNTSYTSAQKPRSFLSRLLNLKPNSVSIMTENEADYPNVDYAAIPIISGWRDGPKINLDEQEDLSDFWYRYVAVGE